MRQKTLTEKIKEEAYRLGFQKVGISPVEELKEGHLFLEWLSKGYHGRMVWMEANKEKRKDPRHVLPGARSIISCAINYHPGQRPLKDMQRGQISLYARGNDYHPVLMQKLEGLVTFIALETGGGAMKSYVDTGPVLEKAWAQRGGIGWIGKNTTLITPEYGSWVFLGEILTTLDLEYDEPGMDQCGSCTKCLEACPTRALTEPYVLDARRCISYLTIELREEIPEELRDRVGHWIFGCDICQEVCPWNQAPQQTEEPAFQPQRETEDRALTELLSLTEEGFRKRFGRTAVKRAKRRGFVRNVAVALGNSGDPAAVEGLTQALSDPDLLVQHHAAWALERIGREETLKSPKEG